jgi:hypothetical protein
MVTSGTILIEPDARHPNCFQVEGMSYPEAWVEVKHGLSPRTLEKELSDTGWNFFYIAGAVQATAFGFDRTKTIGRALRAVIAEVRRLDCNSLEVEGVATHSFLGVRYVSVTAHRRHIQKGLMFAGHSNIRVGEP